MNLSDFNRNAYMLRGSLSKRGYMRWWHSFSGVSTLDGEARTFFVEFLIVNPGLYSSKNCKDFVGTQNDQPILGQHPFFKRRGMKPSYVCIKAGVFPDSNGNGGKQLHAFYPISALKASPSPLVMEVGDCFYSEDHIAGFVDVTEEEARHRFFMTDAGSLEWDLEIHKAVSCHSGLLATPLFQFFNALDSYWHGEGIKSYFRGAVYLDGIKYIVNSDDSNGYSDKHWGRSFNRPWFQFSCGKLYSEKIGKELRHSAFAINGCCPRFFFIPMRRKLLIQLTYTAEDFDFGFSPFFLSRCRWETKETNKRYIWHIIAQNKDAIIKISGSCTKEIMQELQYENPNGTLSPLPLLAGAGAIGTIQLYRRTANGREKLDTLHMSDAFCMYRGEV